MKWGSRKRTFEPLLTEARRPIESQETFVVNRTMTGLPCSRAFRITSARSVTSLKCFATSSLHSSASSSSRSSFAALSAFIMPFASETSSPKKCACAWPRPRMSRAVPFLSKKRTWGVLSSPSGCHALISASSATCTATKRGRSWRTCCPAFMDERKTMQASQWCGTRRTITGFFSPTAFSKTCLRSAVPMKWFVMSASNVSRYSSASL
mmetsp:Transcript_44828/g.116053  ORF Transcript_44828/g.116053 Transcript_44828/m.116053 type:complete len:209 (+) Transcript_44828:946-1572(+)